MTKAQAYGRYFPAWAAVVRAHEWRMRDCRLVGRRLERFGGPEVDKIYQRAWQHAESVALQQCRAVMPDDLRHGVHVAALERDRSSKVLTNAEMDRVLVAMKLLVNPEDVGAMVEWSNRKASEERSQKRRRIWWIEKRCNPAYVTKVTRDMYGETDLWELTPHQVETLYGVLRHRRGALVQPGGCPF